MFNRWHAPPADALLRALAARITEADARGELLKHASELTRLIGDVRSELFHYEVRATYDIVRAPGNMVATVTGATLTVEATAATNMPRPSTSTSWTRARSSTRPRSTSRPSARGSRVSWRSRSRGHPRVAGPPSPTLVAWRASRGKVRPVR